MLLYITLLNFDDFTGPGKERKVKGQIEAMKLKLGEVCYTKYTYPVLYLMKDEEVINKEAVVTRKDCILVLCKWIQQYRVTKTYIRYFRSSKWFIDLLRYQKEYHIKSVVEIPTYPYDGEMKEGISKTEDIIYRKEICKYVDRVTTYSSDKQIWGIECIGLKNGISTSALLVRNKKKEDKKIVLITAGTMMFWQGYERVIEGMHLYYKDGGEYDIRLRIIGDGPEIQGYKDLVEKYKLHSKVEFMGRIETQETDRLNKQYALADIAIAPLGPYKKGLSESSAIKGAEYCAKGLPFIYAGQDFRFPNNWEFLMNVPNGPDPIEMNSVIDFYSRVTENTIYEEKMRDYALNHLTWKNIMRPVIDYFLCNQTKRENIEGM